MNFGNILQDPAQCAEIARNHWNGSKLPDSGPLSSPKVGQPWPVEFMPYWRQYMRERLPTTSTNFLAWATVDDALFWSAVVDHIDDETIVGKGLAWAGMLGNMAAFKAASSASLDYYAVHTLAPSIATSRIAQRAKEQAQLVHPDVVVFMRDTGRWNQTQISQLARAYNVDGADGPSIMRCDRLARGLPGIDPSFYLDWYTKALSQLNWNPDEQAQFVAHIIAQVDKYAPIEEPPYGMALHADVDIGLIRYSLGHGSTRVLDPPWRDNTSRERKEEVMAIYATTNSIAQALCQKTSWAPFVGCHPGMAMMMDLATAKDAMGLYGLASQCKRIALGQKIAIETIILPSLE